MTNGLTAPQRLDKCIARVRIQKLVIARLILELKDDPKEPSGHVPVWKV